MNGGGAVYLCCPSWLDTSVGDLTKQSVLEIWNSPLAQEIRRSILDGTYRYCNLSRCPFYSNLTGPVQEKPDLSDEDIRTVIEKDLTILPFGPRDINCAYDRSCNLSCPSCRTKLIVELKRKDQIMTIQGKIRSQALKDAQYIKITGSGDAFGSPFFRQWLQTMRKTEMPCLKGIYLHTNGQLWTRAMWQTIPLEIRNLIQSSEISIDAATPKTYSINRRGGDFKKLLKNLEFIGTLRKKGPLKLLIVSMVVQENNFEEMPAFVELGKRFGADRVLFSQLVNWGTFTLEEFKKRAIHQSSHPRHVELLKLLEKSIFSDSVAFLGNLSALRTKTPIALEDGGLERDESAP